ncbi:MAG: hypothetical protein CMN80_03390 [Spongiibacter sp.]|uniref:hypothetical protein n=1 Tax=Spongiibacter sp. TaxID=2024860 RepID=UPI000C0AC7E2|nr:hypothetical protein [Spongiibacter sp.]MAK43184.1 hypothetical protein [Spongiibacter sp.]
MSDGILTMQVNMSGYKGRACSLVAIYNPETRMLVLARFNPRRAFVDGRIQVSISPDAKENPTVLFKESSLTDAIQSYFTMVGDATAGDSRLTAISAEKVKKGDPVTPADMPDSSIERDGMDATGWKYRVQEITNKSMAILAACHYIETSYEAAQNAADFAESLFDQLAKGYGVTI